MRILYVITKANWGGAQRYVYDLALAAKEASHDVSVAYGEAAGGQLARALHNAGIPVYSAEGLRRDVGFFTELRALARLVRLLHAAHPDIVHLNSSKAGALGALAARIAGVPRIIFTSHGWPFNEDRGALQRTLFYLAAGITVLLSHETICNSHATYRDIARFPFARRKLVTIPLGIDCARGLPRERARAELAPPSFGNIWVGMISELHPTKRIDDALRAVEMLAERHSDLLLVVIGEGAERERLEGLVRELGLARHVFLAGFREDARKFLSAFDVFLHTSLSESFGYAVAEAGCAEIPVVATSVGAIPELIPDGDHGMLVPPRNPEAAAAALASVIADPMRAHERAARLRARIAQQFTKSRMLAQTLARYSPA